MWTFISKLILSNTRTEHVNRLKMESWTVAFPYEKMHIFFSSPLFSKSIQYECLERLNQVKDWKQHPLKFGDIVPFIECGIDSCILEYWSFSEA